ncbi:MAG: DUF1259 domain-containing protein, partial [Rhodanobacteraceae bacterium]
MRFRGRASLDAAAIGKVAGTKGTLQSDGVVKIGWSRSEVPVTVDGMRLPPAAGLGSWAAFAPMGSQAMVMGDTVVFQDEVDAAMDAAFAHGRRQGYVGCNQGSARGAPATCRRV